MPSFSFSNTAGYYRYAEGVNAANLTMRDIKDANDRLDWFRQRRINDGLLKATRDDPGYKPPEPGSSYVYHDYRNWRKKELKECLIARGFNDEAGSLSMNKYAMVVALKNADKHPRFPRFLDLAPELRNRIYEFAIEDLNPTKQSRVSPATPAISRVNRQLRNETLPFFFRNTCITIVIWHPFAMSSRRETPEIGAKARSYFNHAETAGWLGHMRHFRWLLGGEAFNRTINSTQPWHKRFDVEFSSDMQTVRTRQTLTGKKQDNSSHLEAVQTVMGAVNGNNSLTMMDDVFEAMSEIIMAYVEERCSVVA